MWFKYPQKPVKMNAILIQSVSELFRYSKSVITGGKRRCEAWKVNVDMYDFTATCWHISVLRK
ncbi:hypothetical protein MATL_G00175060 [Megalops atlanticus]|uniref:Uncharacterized protein n=1 Tax=Megalops atlanticus TaxID=7932 RepID=A0A9D3PTS0_MEGAT|nr:hypothetical protein MATL_G00175060 [Megalops atlanticus]